MKLLSAVLIASFAVGLAPAAAVSADTSSPAPAPGLARGDVIAPFDSYTVDGDPLHLDFPKGSSTVLLFFLSSCPVCHRMLPIWSETYANKPTSLRVVGVILDREPRGFFSINPIAFPVTRPPTPAWLQALKIRHVPMTVRVGPGGRVEDLAEGVLDPIRLGELFRK